VKHSLALVLSAAGGSTFVFRVGGGRQPAIDDTAGLVRSGAMPWMSRGALTTICSELLASNDDCMILHETK
jgi:hypothetical protein